MHCHSTCSDGTKTPEELLELAKNQGLSGLSITDHDTTAAYTEDLFASAKKLDLELIPGVEFSSQLGKEGIHVLGYFYDIKSKALKAFCEMHKKRRERRNQKILDLLEHHGMPLSRDELFSSTSGTIGRPHFAKLMCEKGYVSDEKEAFQKYLGDGKPCFSAGMQPTLDETINVIHRAGGLAFFAHPILVRRKRVFREALQRPFDGIECYYSCFPRDRVQPFIDIAEERGLLKSGGSDYHGLASRMVQLGRSFVSEGDLNRIKTRIR